MHDTPIRVDHVGIAVESVADAEPVLRALGCQKLSDEAVTGNGSVPIEEADDEARFRWAYYELGDASRLELIAPIAEDSFIREFLDRQGAGLHHVTLEVADIDAVTDALEAADLRVTDYTSYDSWTEAFLSPRNPTGTLFQLMEYHAEFTEGRHGPGRLFIGGSRVGGDDD